MSNDNPTISEKVQQMYKDRNLTLDETAITIQKVLDAKTRPISAVLTSQKLQRFVTRTCKPRAVSA